MHAGASEVKQAGPEAGLFELWDSDIAAASLTGSDYDMLAQALQISDNLAGLDRAASETVDVREWP
jgi:hypothetical protein